MHTRGGFKEGNKFGKKWEINDLSFSEVSDELTAYCLGFFYADGNLTNKEKSFTFKLNLHKDDVIILNFFKKLLKTNSPIKVDKRGYVLLCINNKNIYLNLEKLGLTSAKTFKIKFPTSDQVPDHLIHHFIRGYFDGDGSFHIPKNRVSGALFKITSNLDFCLGLQKYFINLGFKENRLSNKSSKFDPNKIISTITYGGGVNIEKIYNLLYKDCIFFIPRKRNLIESFLLQRAEYNKIHFNKKRRIFLKSPSGDIIEYFCNFTEICKKSAYQLADGEKLTVKGWRLERVEILS